MKNDLLQRFSPREPSETNEFPEAVELDRWILYNLRHYLRWPGNADMYDDCLQEARLSLWNARRKLSTLSEDARHAYMAICIRHAAKRLLRQELSLGSRLTPLCDVVESVSEEPSSATNELSSRRWLFSLRDANLQKELTALSDRDLEILYLYYTCQMTDSEVAQTLCCSLSAVQQQRRRVLHRLRLRLQQGESTSPNAIADVS